MTFAKLCDCEATNVRWLWSPPGSYLSLSS